MNPSFASITVHEEVVDLVYGVLLLERNEVLLVEIQQFHPIFVDFFCHKRRNDTFKSNLQWASMPPKMSTS